MVQWSLWSLELLISILVGLLSWSCSYGLRLLRIVGILEYCKWCLLVSRHVLNLLNIPVGYSLLTVVCLIYELIDVIVGDLDVPSENTF